MKKENTVLRRLRYPVSIADRLVTEIYFDLKHIQYGWDSKRRNYNRGQPRNNYTENDVISFFEQLNFLPQKPTPQSTHLNTVEFRFVFYIYDEDKRLKMIVDLMKNKSTIIVTIH